MRKIKWILLILFFNISICKSDISGNDLLNSCNDAIRVINNNYYAPNLYRIPEQFFNSGFCFGYIKSVIALMDNSNSFCLPLTVTNGQFVRIVTRFLNDNPEKLHYAAQPTVMYALYKTFPCHKMASVTDQNLTSQLNSNK